MIVQSPAVRFHGTALCRVPQILREISVVLADDAVRDGHRRELRCGRLPDGVGRVRQTGHGAHLGAGKVAVVGTGWQVVGMVTPSEGRKGSSS